MVREQPSFAHLLRAYRAKAKLSQESLATKSGVSEEAIGALERGRRLHPQASTVGLLVDALGLDPEQKDAFFAAARRPPQRGAAPDELPCPPADFTGRERELSMLESLLDPHRSGEWGRQIVAIDGMGGAGKSALAIHAAHRLAGCYPDGQLYVDLRGLTPLCALRCLLHSLGSSASANPADAGEAARRWRSLTAGRRLLVVLDNATSVEQVRPLLPSGRCGVLVTSRPVLATLEGIQAVHLDVLSEKDARSLLSRIGGPDRVVAEPGAATDVVRMCGCLPLALRIAGARLAARPTWGLAELAQHLSDPRRRLDELEVGELSVRACFDVSLAGVEAAMAPTSPAAAADILGLLAQPDGPDLGLATAARLLDQPETVTRALLAPLVDARLIENPHPFRYRLHDLVRVYAREHAGRRSEAERAEALGRTFGFYTATAWNALSLLRPSSWRLATADARWRIGGLDFADASGALGWLEEERPNLIAAIAQAANARAEAGALAPELPGQLSRALHYFLEIRGHWPDWVRANKIVAAVARRTRDRAGEAIALNDLGLAYLHRGLLRQAIDHLHDSQVIWRELGDRQGQAWSLSNHGMACCRLGLCDQAIASLEESAGISRQMGDRGALANSLMNLGQVHDRRGCHEEATRCQEEALEVAREVGDRRLQASCLRHLGALHGRRGRYVEAIACLHESLMLCRYLDYRDRQADALVELGVVYRRLGRNEEAIGRLEEGLLVYRTLGHRYGQVVAARELGDSLRAASLPERAAVVWTEGLAVAERLGIAEAEEIRSRLDGLAAAATPAPSLPVP